MAARGFVSGQTHGGFASKIWVDDATASWTTSAGVASKLGYREMVFDFGPATATTTASALSTIANITGAVDAAGKITAGTSLGVVDTGVWVDAANNRWTTSATVASSLGGFTQLQVTLDGAESNFGDVAAKVAAQNNLSPYANNVERTGKTWTEAEAIIKAQIKTSNPTPPQGLDYVKRVTAIGDTVGGVRGRLAQKLLNQGYGAADSQLTNVTARKMDDAASKERLKGVLQGLDNQISSRAITSADVPSAKGAMARTENPQVTKKLEGAIDASKRTHQVGDAKSDSSIFTADALAEAINQNSKQFWAMVQKVDSMGKAADMVYVFTKDGGDFNDLLACEVAGSDTRSREALGSVAFENEWKAVRPRQKVWAYLSIP
jgi:hypothetical protein